jgi:hypothetical protein
MMLGGRYALGSKKKYGLRNGILTGNRVGTGRYRKGNKKNGLGKAFA